VDRTNYFLIKNELDISDYLQEENGDGNTLKLPVNRFNKNILIFNILQKIHHLSFRDLKALLFVG